MIIPNVSKLHIPYNIFAKLGNVLILAPVSVKCETCREGKADTPNINLRAGYLTKE